MLPNNTLERTVNGRGRLVRNRLVTEVYVVVFASGLALFLSGAGVGASIAEWYFGVGSWSGSLGASMLIAVLAAGSLRKEFARLQSTAR
jgi:hypothetical protein